jgi:hypothetical protein
VDVEQRGQAILLDGVLVDRLERHHVAEHPLAVEPQRPALARLAHRFALQRIEGTDADAHDVVAIEREPTDARTDPQVRPALGAVVHDRPRVPDERFEPLGAVADLDDQLAVQLARWIELECAAHRSATGAVVAGLEPPRAGGELREQREQDERAGARHGER